MRFAINSAWQETVENALFFLNHGKIAKPPLTARITQVGERFTENTASAEYEQ